MESQELLQLKYPNGKFIAPEVVSEQDIQQYIENIASLPSRLNSKVVHFNDMQLDTPYREGGWTVRQVIHHVADSHMNGYIRFKLAITENNPVINAYQEAIWAEMKDGKSLPIAVSLQIIEAVHLRWTIFLRTLQFQDFQKTYFHPEKKRNVPLTEACASYSWHCDHHLAHISSLAKRMNWK